MKISFRQIIAENGVTARDYNNPEYIKTLLAQYIQSPEWKKSYEQGKLKDFVYQIAKLSKSAIGDTLRNIADLEMNKRFGYKDSTDYLSKVPDEEWEKEETRIDQARDEGDYDTDNKYELEGRKIENARDEFMKAAEANLVEFFRDHFRNQIIATFDQVYDMTEEQFEDF